MKVYNKFTYAIIAMGLAGTVLSSCDDSKTVEYDPAAPVGDAVYFPSSAPTEYEMSDETNKISIPVYRTNGDGALTVNISVEAFDDYDSPFSYSDYVTFEDGETETTLDFTYSYLPDEYGYYEEYELNIDGEYSSPYGQSTLLITLIYPEPWTSLGTGIYYDLLLGVSDGDPESKNPYIQAGYAVEREIEQSDLDPNLYRVYNPYKELNGEDSYFVFRTLQVGDIFLNQTITIPDLVVYDPYLTGRDPNGTQYLTIYFPGYLRGNEDQNLWKFNVVADYKPDGTPGAITIAPYYLYEEDGGLRGYSFADNPPIEIDFPGYEAMDIGIELEYEGLLTTSSGIYAQALLDMGSDLSLVKVGVAAGTDADAISTAIDKGTIESIEVYGSGQIRVPFTGSETGKYSLVAVGYIGDEVKSVSAASFNYVASNEPDPNEGWTSLGYLDYTDGYICSFFTVDVMTYEVEIQQNNENANYYRLVNPYGEAYPYNEPGDWDAMINSYLYIGMFDDQRVYVDLSPQTMNWGYGEFSMWSLAAGRLVNGSTMDQVIEAGFFGKLENGKITFPAEVLMISMAEYNNGGWYTANFAGDPETGGATPIYNADGTVYAPFCVDFNTLSKTRSLNSVSANTARNMIRLMGKPKPVDLFKKAAGHGRVLKKMNFNEPVKVMLNNN